MKELKEVEAVAPEWYQSGEDAPSDSLKAQWEFLKERDLILCD